MSPRVEHGRWTCEQCGTKFDRDKSGPRPIRFCGSDCYQDWRRATGASAGQFTSTHVPWNKGIKGLHLSPASQWKKGQRSRNWLPVGSETVRVDKNGKERAFVKVAEPAVWRERAIVVWEQQTGCTLPAGHVIHHKDRDTLNDGIANLECLSRAEHVAEHRSELQAARTSVSA